MNTALRPSALPILALSPLWQPGDPTAYADAGTERHRALAMHYAGIDGALFGLDDDEAEAITWAADQIRLLSPVNDFAPQFEQPKTLTLPDFTEITGTPDVVVGPHIFDLKWRVRNYDAQLAAYTLAVLQENPDWPLVTCHILFGAFRRVQTLEFDLDSATALVWDIVQRSRAAIRCKTSVYCSWCKIRPGCPVYVEQAELIAAGREDWPPPKTFHSSKITDPEEMAKALRLARLLRPWCESVEHFALEMSTKLGLVPTGYELKQTAGKSYVRDAAAAFPLAELPTEEFLQCCDVRLNTSKDYPEKVGVIDTHAKRYRMKRAAAKREILAMLAPVIAPGRGGLKLKEIKSKPAEEEPEEIENADDFVREWPTTEE